MKMDDLVRPIRTRGAIRKRGAAENELPTAPIRTRGGVRVAGVVAAQPPEVLTVPALVEELRERSDPLSIVVYGWGGEQAKKFVAKLRPHLGPGDGVTLLPSKQADTAATPVPQGAVLLDWNHPTDRRIYDNGHLVGDIVFFCESKEWGLDELGKWKDFTDDVVVPTDDPQVDACLGEVRKSERYGYLWDGENLRLYSGHNGKPQA